MYALFASYCTAWNRKDGDRRMDAFFIPIASFLIACVGLFLTVHTELGFGLFPHPYWWLPPALLAALALVTPVRAVVSVGDWRWRLGVIPLVFIGALPAETRIGVIFLAAASVASWWIGSRPATAMRLFPGVARTAGVLAEVSLLLLLTSFLGGVFDHIAARTEGLPWAASCLSLLLRLGGVTAHAAGGDGILYFTHSGGTQPALVSLDKFGGSLAPLLLLLVAAQSWWRGRAAASIALSAIVILGYSFLRTGALLSAIVLAETTITWWDERFIALSYLPLLFLLPTLLGATSSVSAEDEPRLAAGNGAETSRLKASSPSAALRFAAAIAGAFLIICAWFWVDPGVRKTGLVLIDERYSRWEWSERPLNTRLFGVQTVYSYYNMVEALAHYYPIRRNFADINEETLRDVSVLILKTPTSPYPPETLAAIDGFVARGGGVWLIGDHTNVFGMDTYLNQVLSRYGAAFRKDAVVDPNSMRQLFRPEPSAHPMVRRLPLFLMYTSDSLQGPWFSPDALRNRRLLRDNADIASNTFFGNFTPDVDEMIGPTTQALALESGRGRIAVWSDSTLFSNFAIFLPGKMELALGAIDWLNRANSPIPWRGVLCVFGAGLLIVAFLPLFLHRRADGAGEQRAALPFLALCLGGLLSVPAMILGFDKSYPARTPFAPFETVAFLDPDIPGHLPVYEPFDEPDGHNYLSAFVAAQRVGKRPFMTASVAEAIRSPLVVVIHNHNPFTTADAAQLENYVRQGGRLLLLDTGGEGELFLRLTAAAGARRIAAPIPSPDPNSLRQTLMANTAIPARVLRSMLETDLVRALPDRPTLPPLVTVSGKTLQRTKVAWTIQGGSALLMYRPENAPSDKTGGAVVTEARVGRGMVVLTTTNNLFSAAFLGGDAEIPNDRQMAAFNWLFAWYRGESAVPPSK